MTSAWRTGAILLGGLLLAAPPCLGQSSGTDGAAAPATPATPATTTEDKAPSGDQAGDKSPADAGGTAVTGSVTAAPDLTANQALLRRRAGLRSAAITLGVLGIAGLVASGVANGLDGRVGAGTCAYYGMNYGSCVYQFNTTGYVTGYAVSGAVLVTSIMLGFVSTF